MLGVMNWLNRRIEKHITLQICTFLFAGNTIWLVSLRLLGFLPENGHPMIFILILLGVFIGSATGIWFSTITSSIVADLADEQELLTHERQEGMFFAAQLFSLKFVTGIGNFVGGFVLDWVGMPVNAQPGTVPADVLVKLGIVMGPVLGAFMVAPYVFARKIEMTKERYTEVSAALTARHAAGN